MRANRHSQYGEELILADLFVGVGSPTMHAVEFGAGDGYLYSNTRRFVEEGWTCLMMDGDGRGNAEVMEEWITAENIDHLLSKYGTPTQFDLLSVDLDGNDYYVLDAILCAGYRPRVVVVEFNCGREPESTQAMRYNPDHAWGEDNYYGMSLGAGKHLAKKHGYVPVKQNMNLNLFLVDSSVWQGPLPDFTCEHIQYYPVKRKQDWVDVTKLP